MINFKNVEKYCCEDISLIENYEQANSDKENMWICHHRQGTYISHKELLELGWYYNCPSDCLIFLTKEQHSSIHHKNKIESDETKSKKSKSHYKIPKSEFGRKFIEHFGTTRSENSKLYDKERYYFRIHNKCSWED